jgi:hypothetical protein
MKAISIKQPWAWLIVNGYKDIENRTWRTKHRGEIMIHTGKGLDMAEYHRAKELCDKLGIELPAPFDLPTGGYVGKCHIVDVVTSTCSPWFFGPVGFVLKYPSTIYFQPACGKLNVYNIS